MKKKVYVNLIGLVFSTCNLYASDLNMFSKSQRFLVKLLLLTSIAIVQPAVATADKGEFPKDVIGVYLPEGSELILGRFSLLFLNQNGTGVFEENGKYLSIRWKSYRKFQCLRDDAQFMQDKVYKITFNPWSDSNDIHEIFLGKISSGVKKGKFFLARRLQNWRCAGTQMLSTGEFSSNSQQYQKLKKMCEDKFETFPSFSGEVNKDLSEPMTSASCGELESYRRLVPKHWSSTRLLLGDCEEGDKKNAEWCTGYSQVRGVDIMACKYNPVTERFQRFLTFCELDGYCRFTNQPDKFPDLRECSQGPRFFSAFLQLQYNYEVNYESHPMNDPAPCKGKECGYFHQPPHHCDYSPGSDTDEFRYIWVTAGSLRGASQNVCEDLKTLSQRKARQLCQAKFGQRAIPILPAIRYQMIEEGEIRRCISLPNNTGGRDFQLNCGCG